MMTNKKINLLGISGRLGSGKDTVGNILQWIATSKTGFGNGTYSNKECVEWLNDKYPGDTSIQKISGYQIKKFADKLKDMVCLLIGCTREQLEDREFKEKELGEEWNIWVLVPNPDHNLFDGNCQLHEAIFSSSDKAKKYIKEHKIINVLDIEKRALTPRKLLQLLGTEAGREILHPNLWVNALFANYLTPGEKCGLTSYSIRDIKEGFKDKPNWIITDVRFENEAQAIKDKGGIVIRVNRWIDKELTKEEALDLFYKKEENVYGVDDYGVEALIKDREDFNNFERFVTAKSLSNHSSETSLDDYEFDHVIDNNSDIPSLIEKVKQLKLV